MRIGPHTLAPFKPGMPVLTLAPLAGVGNWVFRLICARLGAKIVGVEFINCRNVHEKSRRQARLMDFSDAEIYRDTEMSLLAAQIYGNDETLIASSAQLLEERGTDVLDINFGCSVPRIVQKGSGAAYLKDLDRLYEAVRLTVEAVSIPVIVKTRIGWDATDINILEVIDRVTAAGAQAIAIHARTVAQKYKGRADWDWIARAKERATIPVLGNGDVCTYDDAVAMQQHTGCDAVMIGRAAMANPWIFSGRRGALLIERIDLALDQLRLMAVYKGERVGILETRKHLALYFRSLPRTSDLRASLLTAGTLTELADLLNAWRESADPQDHEEDMSLTPVEADALAWGGTD